MKSVQFQIPLNKLAVCVAVSLACHTVYAKSPFAPEPLHLIDKSVKKYKSTAKPNVMLFVDDSGSMKTYVDAKMQKCSLRNDVWTYGVTKYWNQDCMFESDGTPVYRTSARAGGLYGGYKAAPGVLNRIQVVQNALTDVVKDAGDDVHWNLMTLWGTEKYNQMPMSAPNFKANYDPKNKTPASKDYVDSAEILNFIKRLRPAAGTPTTMRYLQAVDSAIDAMKYRCQVNAIVMLSDGDANEEGPWRTEDYKNLKPGKSVFGELPSNGEIPPSGYHPHGGNAGNGISYFSKKLIERDLKTSGVDDEGNPWVDARTSPGEPYAGQYIETYTVGFGRGLSGQGRRYLQNAGAARKNVQTYYTADNSKELLDAFNEILANATSPPEDGSNAQETISVTTPSNTSSPVANLAATMTLNTKIWGSELQFSEIEQGGLPKKDSSGKYITKPAKYEGRRVLMNNGTNIYWLDEGAVPGYAHDDFGFKNEDEFLNAFLPWLRRDPTETDEQIEKYAATLKDRTVEKYRKRTDSATSPARQMGDVLDASILGVGENPKYVVTGANDGMVYIFRATNGTAEPYELALNYLPGGMERDDPADTLAKKLKNIAESTYTSPKNVHIYGVDGGITYTKTAKTAGRNQRTIALGAMGKGGKGVYALHISGCERSAAAGCSPVGLDAGANSWISTVPAWESEKGKGNTLGYTVGTPRMYQLAKSWDNGSPKIEQNVILGGFVANGFEGKEEPSLYIYDAMGEEMGTSKSASLSNGDEGKLLTKIKVRNDGVIGALASPTLVDVDFDGIVDIAYAGDFDGDMYRFDLRESIGNLSVGKIYDGDPSQPITAAPAVYRNDENSYIVVFGTGSDLFEKDRTNTDQQVFMGIYDDLSKAPKAATQSNLLKQTLTNEGDKTRIVSDNAFDKSKYSGWVIDLAKGGTSTNSTQNSQVTKTSSSEIVVSTPSILLSTAFFTTRIYATEEQNSGSGNTGNNVETCKASTESEKSDGTSWMMAIDVKNGGMPRVGQSATFREGQYEKKAGFNLDVISSSTNLVSESALKGESPSVGVNGNVVNGVQQDLTKGKQKKNNACLASNDYFAMVAQAKKDDPLKSVAIKGKLCGGRLIRVNTREIREF